MCLCDSSRRDVTSEVEKMRATIPPNEVGKRAQEVTRGAENDDNDNDDE